MVSNFSVTGTITIQNDYLIAQLLNITLQNINAILNKPQIPGIEFGNTGSSANIITNVVKSLAHSTVNYFNPELAQSKLGKVPHFIPNPEIKLVDLSDDNINDYIEFTASCSCFNDSLGIYPVCYNVPQCLNVTTQTQTQKFNNNNKYSNYNHC